MEEVLGQLIEFLKSASPFVWETLIKQVYVDAFGYIAWSLALFLVAYMLFGMGKHCSKMLESDEVSYNDEEGYIWGKWLSYVVSLIFAVIAFGLLVSALSKMSNPDFYAINYLIGQFK